MTNSREYMKEWTRRTRKALIEALGGKCIKCEKTDDLEFHHPYGRDWKMEKTSQSNRLSRVRAEMKAGLVEVLCGTCNKMVGDPTR